jgi:DNA primase
VTDGVPERFARIRAAVQLSDVIGQRVTLKRRGTLHKGLCPFHNEKTPSLVVDDNKERWKCFGCGAGGDVVDFVAKWENIDAMAALARLEQERGLSAAGAFDHAAARAARAKADEEERQRVISAARKLWFDSVPLTGTPAETYLRGRGITIDPGPALRFHPDLRHQPSGERLPAMVAAVTDATGYVTGVHRTYLGPDGATKASVAPAKMMLGACGGGCTRFGRPDAAGGQRLGIGEGIETCLSVRQATGLPVWAALTLGNMGALPVPRPVREIILLADADEKDRAAADRQRAAAADRYAGLGFWVRLAVPPDGTDFNDLLRRAGSVPADAADPAAPS